MEFRISSGSSEMDGRKRTEKESEHNYSGLVMMLVNIR